MLRVPVPAYKAREAVAAPQTARAAAAPYKLPAAGKTEFPEFFSNPLSSPAALPDGQGVELPDLPEDMDSLEKAKAYMAMLARPERGAP